MSFVEELPSEEQKRRRNEAMESLSRLEALSLSELTLGELNFISQLVIKVAKYEYPGQDELNRLKGLERRLPQIPLDMS